MKYTQKRGENQRKTRKIKGGGELWSKITETLGFTPKQEYSSDVTPPKQERTWSEYFSEMGKNKPEDTKLSETQNPMHQVTNSPPTTFSPTNQPSVGGKKRKHKNPKNKSKKTRNKSE